MGDKNTHFLVLTSLPLDVRFRPLAARFGFVEKTIGDGDPGSRGDMHAPPRSDPGLRRDHLLALCGFTLQQSLLLE